jgi:hypothetical protein
MFYSGIKSKSTKETADRLLRFFLIDVCVDLLQGDYKNVELIVIIRVTLQKAIKFYHF